MTDSIDAGIIIFPTPYVFRYKVENHEEIKQQLLPQFIQEYEENKNNIDYKWQENSTSTVVTNYNTHDNRYYTQDHYDSIVWKPLNLLYQTLFAKDAPFILSDKHPTKSSIEMLWWNVYDKGSYAVTHNHGYGKVSGIYLLELNETNSTTFLMDDSHPFGPTPSRMFHTTDYAQEGDVILFPSSLLHFVNPAIKRRVTISFNVFTDFDETNE